MTWAGWENFDPATGPGAPAKAPKPKSTAKYHATATHVGGTRFDSKREADHWLQLQALERAGQIRHLRRQVPFSLNVTTPDRLSVCIGRYIADFVFVEGDVTVVEDAKGVRTPLYRWKRAHLAAQYGIQVREV